MKPMRMDLRSAGTVAFSLGVGLAGCSEGATGMVGDDLPAMTIVTSGATTPTIAIHPMTGRAYVAWIAADGEGVHNVYLTSAEAGSSVFSEPVRVNDIPGDAANHEQAPAQVAVAPGGEVFVVWQNNTVIEGREYPASNLRLATSTDGGATFGPAVNVNDDAGGAPSSHTFHNIAVGAGGTVLVSWIDGREQDRLARQASEEAAPTTLPWGPEIRVALSTDRGATFAPSVVVDNNSCPCCRTSIAVGPDGSSYIAWRKNFPNEIRDIVVAAAPPGSLDFGEPVRVHPDEWEFPGCPHAGPSLGTDPEGRVHVGWYTGKEDRQGLWYAVSDDGAATFAAPIPLVTGDFVPPSQVALTRVGSEVVAAWEDRTGETGSVVIGKPSSGSGPVGEAVSVGRGPALQGGPESALLVWLEGDAIRGQWIGQSD